VQAVHGANLDTGGVLDADAGLGNNKGHEGIVTPINDWVEVGRANTGQIGILDVP
jgi:hypothetical protein